MHCKTWRGSWRTSKGNSLEIIFCGTGPQRSFSFLASLPSGCAHVKRGHQKAVMVERRARPTPSPLFLGPVVRGQLSRQLSRHCSLPGKSTTGDVLGQAWEWVRVPVKMGLQVCLGKEASKGFEIQEWLCGTRDSRVAPCFSPLTAPVGYRLSRCVCRTN